MPSVNVNESGRREAAQSGLPNQMSATEGALGAASWQRKRVIAAAVLSMFFTILACATVASYVLLRAHETVGLLLLEGMRQLVGVCFYGVYVLRQFAPPSSAQGAMGLAERIVLSALFWVVCAALLVIGKSLHAVESIALNPPPGGPADRRRYHPDHEYGREYATAAYTCPTAAAILVTIPALLESRLGAARPTLFKWFGIAFAVLGLGLMNILLSMRVIDAMFYTGAMLVLLSPSVFLSLFRDWHIDDGKLTVADPITYDPWYLAGAYNLLNLGPWFVAKVAATFEDSHKVLTVGVNQVPVTGGLLN